MVNDRRVGPAFRLRAFARVVDDKGIEQGHVFQRYFGVTGIGKTNPFARQPFHGAVFANVNHSVGLEHVSNPSVIGHVMVGGR